MTTRFWGRSLVRSIFVAVLLIGTLPLIGDPPEEGGGGGESGGPSAPAAPSPVIEGQFTIDPETRRLGDLIPGDPALRPPALNDYFTSQFNKTAVDSITRTLFIRTTRLSDLTVLRIFLKDTDPAAPPHGNVKVKFALANNLSGCGTGGSATGACIIAYRLGATTGFLENPTTEVELSGVTSNYTNVPAATLVLRNTGDSPVDLQPSDLKLTVTDSTGAHDIVPSGPIRVYTLNSGYCRVIASGAAGTVHSKTCSTSTCTADQETRVANGALRFRAILEDVPAMQSQPQQVRWRGGPDSLGYYAMPPVSSASDVVAEVTTATGRTLYCAVKIKPDGQAYKFGLKLGGGCPLHAGIRQHYYYKKTSSGYVAMTASDSYENGNGLTFPNLGFWYGTNKDPQTSNPTRTKGPDIPFRGIDNFATDTSGMLRIGVGGTWQLPPIAERVYAAPVIVFTPFNPEKTQEDPYGRPIYYAVIGPNTDVSDLAAIPVPGSNPSALNDQTPIVARIFLAASTKNAAGTVEMRGAEGYPDYWSFNPALNDRIVMQMDSSCNPMTQIGMPMRGDMDVPPELKGTFCTDSGPMMLGALRNGRVKLAALGIVPTSPFHGYPTARLRRSRRANTTVMNPGDVTDCWDFRWALPPNVGADAVTSHGQCTYWTQINTTTVSYDRYGRPYNVTVPTWVQNFRNNCAVIEPGPQECSSGLAVRFNGFAQMQAGALGCVAKYDNNGSLSGIAATATLPGQGILPYTSFGGSAPQSYTSYDFGTAPKMGYGCVPCRFGTGLEASTAAIPLDNSSGKPIFTFRRVTGVATETVQTANLEVRYFGSEVCTGQPTPLPAGHFCSSGNIAAQSCPGNSEVVAGKGTFSGGGNIAGKYSVKLCPGAGLEFDDVAVSWSPLVLDIKGQEIRISRSFEQAVMFDIKGIGRRVLVDWPINTNEAAFLVRPDKNGRVTSIKQLFGDYKAFNGFESLRKIDRNKDGIIDVKDKAFKELRLWFDRDRNGLASAAEIESLEKHGVNTLYLAYYRPTTKGIQGKTLAGVYFNSVAKEFRNMQDVFFFEYWKNGQRLGETTPKKRGG